MRAWGAIGRFELGQPLHPWLARIATNQAYSLFRHRKRRPETSIEPLVEAGMQWGTDDDPADHTALTSKARNFARPSTLSSEHQAVRWGCAPCFALLLLSPYKHPCHYEASFLRPSHFRSTSS